MMNDKIMEAIEATLSEAIERAETAERERDEAVAERNRLREFVEIRNPNVYDIFNQLQTVKGELYDMKVERDEARASVAVCVEALEAVVSHYKENKFFRDDGNAPGHCHDKPGVWDLDNGKLANQPCEWCATWKRVNGLLSNLPAAAREMLERVKEAEKERDVLALTYEMSEARILGKAHMAEITSLQAELDALKRKCAAVEGLVADCEMPLVVDKQGAIEMCVRDSQKQWVSMNAVCDALNAFAREGAG
jgi:hypothetical protein